MKKLAILVTLLVVVAFVAGAAIAAPAGKQLVYDGGAMGKVTFDGGTHAKAGNKCPDCHTGIFQYKQGSAKITAPHKPGEFCGNCHDGKKAFAQEGNCAKCHVK